MAEFAVALPAVLLVLAMMLGGVQLGVVQLRLQDAAADAARSLGRGESAAVVTQQLSRGMSSARWGASRSAGLVCVRILADAPPPAALLGLQASATSCALEET